jgi:general secretion pathway protein I
MRPRRSRPRGFTLVESVTALFVFSLAAVAVLELNAGNARAMAQIESSVYARIVADNQMALALGSVVAPPRGLASGVETLAGRNWAWTRVVSPTTDESIDRVDVVVRQGEEDRVAASLSGFRGRE